MSQRMLAFFLGGALVLAAATLAMGAAKGEPLFFSADLAPLHGPVAKYPPTDDTWDLLFTSNAEQTCGDFQLLGCAFAEGKFFVTGGNNSSSPNKLYILSPTGTLLDTIDQPTMSLWGWRDLAYDGTYLYAGDEGYTIHAFDTNGNLVPSMDIPKPPEVAIVRGLTYNPATDRFWTANFAGNIVEFDRFGSVFWSGSPAPLTSIYGLAWDAAAPSGPWMWIYDQSGSPQTTFYQFDPLTHALTGVAYTVPLLPGATTQLAGGCEMNDEWSAFGWTMAALIQGTPQDLLYVLEMYIPPVSPDAPAAPTDFTVSNNGPLLRATLDWINPTMTVIGNPLTSISSVRILREGAAIDTLTGTPGQTMTYTDTLLVIGEYTYKVFATNAAGNGLPALATAWIGLDTPDEVLHLIGQGIGDDLLAYLSWDNPPNGAHGGYFFPASLTGYLINRYGTSAANFTHTGIDTSFTDSTITTAGWYYYGVLPQNASGNGPESLSDSFYIGPPGYEQIPYFWVEINPAKGGLPGLNANINDDDQNVGPFPLGFTFNHYDNLYSTLRLCSNGWASFNSTSISLNNTIIPSPTLPNNLLAIYWDDLDANSATGFGQVFYYHDPVNQRFIVEFDSMAHFGAGITGEYFTFEAILYPGGDLDYSYKAIIPGTMTNFPSASVGKENAVGTAGVQVTYNGSGLLEPASNLTLRVLGQPPPVSIAMTPVSYPIIIPSTGGSFGFNISLANNSASPAAFEAWVMAQMPDGAWYGPVLGPADLSLPAGASLTRLRTQNVPAWAPGGTYLYEGRIGTYPNIIVAFSNFVFVKSGTGDGFPINDWNNSGAEFASGANPSSAAVPGIPLLLNPHPNPFNQATTFVFSLPAAGQIRLSLFDLAGREVVVPVEGWYEAGFHQFNFQAADLPSGLYLCRLSTGGQQCIRKLVIIK